MRASGRLPYSHRDPSRPVRGGDRLGLSIGALAHRLMNLRATLSRRLAGPPQRPDYTVAATRPTPSWMTSPQALVGRNEVGLAFRPAPAIQAWPAGIFDDRATLDMIPRRADPSARFDEGLMEGETPAPRVLIRTPRRPAAIMPETGEIPSAGPAASAPEPSPAVRYTRTPDPVLHERRQRALDAERAARAQAHAEAEAEALRLQAEQEALRAEAEAQALAAQAAQAEAEALAAQVPEPLWRQPFVAPPGVRFFRSPDRRQGRPSAEASSTQTLSADLPATDAAVIEVAPVPAPVILDDRDWSDVPDWSEVHAWFDGRDGAALDAWSAIQAEAAPLPEAPAEDTPEALAIEAVEAPELAAPVFAPAPLPANAPAPVASYRLEHVVRFETFGPPCPVEGQDNALPVPSPVRPAPLHAMAARAAIRAGRPAAPAPSVTAEVLPAAPAPSPALSAASQFVPVAPFVPAPRAAAPAFVPTAIPPRPVLLRSPKGAPGAEPEAPAPIQAEPRQVEAPEAGLPEVPASEVSASEGPASEFVAPEVEAAPEAPAAGPLPAVHMPRAILPERPLLIPAGRHVPMSFVENADYEHPSLELLAEPPLNDTEEVDADVLEQNALNLQQTVQDFGVRGDILAVRPGPVVTLYELEPAPGTKSSRVISLSDDIARSMSAVSARVAVVPGRNVIGIELPNDTRETVYLRELLASADFGMSKHKLALCLGKNIGGEPIIADLAKMPHLLVAGTTGSGKSVAINTMILSLLYRMKPEECRLIMVDPKMLELSVYDGIPHLLSPVVIDPKKAVIALKWAVREMEERYKKMSKIAVRNIDGYNARMAEARAKGETITREVHTGFNRETGQAVYETEEMDLSALPYIVIVVDEMADLMMVAGKDIEGAIQRLAQMARAAGIHLIMATQRPSVDVITGTIKANFPTRISFQVTSKIDSRTILGEMGAEQLLGQGDMLFMAGGGRTTRVHGPFCSDSEVESVVAHLKRQGRPSYLEAVTADDGSGDEKPAKGAKADKAERAEKAQATEIEDIDAPIFDAGAYAGSGGIDPGAELYDQAVQVVLRDKKASTSYIQRRLQIGYNRAASIMERMEIEGIVGPANHAGKREILMEGGHAASGMMDYDD
jgi:S-DNA-T family DNA segregation ATPase FtsK/SpoIIIE